MVNALLGRPGLSPAGPAVTTSAYLVFRGRRPEQALVPAGESGEPLAVAIDELAWCATASSSPIAGAQRIDVDVDAPLLDRLVLIDTPGVGGLVAGHAEIALQALDHASALLFVLDATGVLTRPELEFLQRASERIDQVLFVLTKKDLCPGWRSVLAEDQALLAKHAPRFAGAPFLAVSGVLAEEGAWCENADLAAELRDESGLPALETLLRQRIIPHAETLALSNLLRLTRTLLGRLHQTIREQAAAAAADPELHAAWEREKERLEKVQRESGSWTLQLENRLTHAKIDVTRELNSGLNDIRRRWQGRLAEEKLRADAEDTLVQQLTADIVAMIEQLNRRLSDDVARIVTDILTDLAAPPAAQLADLLAAAVPELPPLPSPGRRPGGGERALAEMANLTTGRMTAMVLLAPLGSLTPGSPLAMLGMVGFMAIARKWRLVGQRRQELQAWLRDAVQETGTEIRSQVDIALADARLEIVSAVRTAVQQRTDEVKRALDLSSEALHLDKVTRQRNQQQAVTRLGEIRKLASQADQILVQCAHLLSKSASEAAGAGGPGSRDRPPRTADEPNVIDLVEAQDPRDPSDVTLGRAVILVEDPQRTAGTVSRRRLRADAPPS